MRTPDDLAHDIGGVLVVLDVQDVKHLGGRLRQVVKLGHKVESRRGDVCGRAGRQVYGVCSRTRVFVCLRVVGDTGAVGEKRWRRCPTSGLSARASGQTWSQG